MRDAVLPTGMQVRPIGWVSAEDSASCAEERLSPPRDAADDDWFKCTVPGRVGKSTGEPL